MKKIDLGVAKAMVGHYAETRKKVLDSAHKIDDTTSIWFSADDIRELVKDLDAGASGVRIYLASHDTTHPETPNQTTIVAIGTAENSPGDHVDKIAGHTQTGMFEPRNNGKICPPNCPPPPPPPNQ
jgi:hypothetical protein